MEWKRVTEEEAKSLYFDYDEASIVQGVKDARPAMAAAGCFGPEEQKEALASGKVDITYKDGKPIYSSKGCYGKSKSNS